MKTHEKKETVGFKASKAYVVKKNRPSKIDNRVEKPRKIDDNICMNDPEED